MRRTLCGLVVGLASLAAACSAGYDLSDADLELVDVIAQQAAAVSDDNTDAIDQICRATALVEALEGADNLAETQGMTIDGLRGAIDPYANLDLTEAQATELTEQFWECGDFKTGILNDALGGNQSPEATTCFVDGIDDDVVTEISTAKLMGPDGAERLGAVGEELFSQAMSAMDDCGFP